jgi:hypothetical protein
LRTVRGQCALRRCGRGGPRRARGCSELRGEGAVGGGGEVAAPLTCLAMFTTPTSTPWTSPAAFTTPSRRPRTVSAALTRRPTAMGSVPGQRGGGIGSLRLAEWRPDAWGVVRGELGVSTIVEIALPIDGVDCVGFPSRGTVCRHNALGAAWVRPVDRRDAQRASQLNARSRPGEGTSESGSYAINCSLALVDFGSCGLI